MHRINKINPENSKIQEFMKPFLTKRLMIAGRLGGVASGLMLSACMTATIPPELSQGVSRPFIDISARSAAIQELSVSDKYKYCSTPAQSFISASPKVTLSGEISTAAVNVQYCFSSLNHMIAAHVMGEKNALENIKATLFEAAQMNAFELVDRYTGGFTDYNPYNEGIFHQSLLLLSLGIIYPELERHYGKENNEVISIRLWGDRLFSIGNSGRDDFIGRYRGVDRAAGKAAAFSAWGTSTNNKAALAAGYRYYRRAISSIGSGGKDTIWGRTGSKRLYYTNMTYGWSVVAAEALVRAGLTNAYDLPGEGRSLHDGVAWLVTALVENKHMIAARGKTDGSRNLAWAEYYAARFPDRSISELINKTLERRRLYGSMIGGMVGGSTTCLVKPIEKGS